MENTGMLCTVSETTEKDRGEKEQYDQRYSLSIIRMGYPKRKTVSYDGTRNLTYFLDHNNKKLERNNQERRKSMKRIKKTLKGKGKIVAALAVVISFAAVLV